MKKAVVADASAGITKRDNLLQRIWKARYGYFFIAPGYLAFALFVFVPIITAVVLAFYDANPVSRTWVGFGNFQSLLTDKTFARVLRNTFTYVAVLTPISLILPLIIALLVFDLPRWLQSIIRGGFYLPSVTGGVIMSVVWLWIFNPTYGLLNFLLSSLGIEPILWLASNKTSLFAVCVVVTTWGIGQPLIIYMAALGSIPPELIDAAKVDGASGIQRAVRIIIPLLRPATFFVLTTSLIGWFQIWEAIFMLTSGGPGNSSASIVYKIYEQAFIFGKYGLASAMGVVLMVVILVVTLAQVKLWGEDSLGTG